MPITSIEFKKHPITHGNVVAIQIIVKFSNGYEASIVGGMDFSNDAPLNQAGLYGNGLSSFELAVMSNGDLDYTTPVADDVLGYQTPEQITELLWQIEALTTKG